MNEIIELIVDAHEYRPVAVPLKVAARPRQTLFRGKQPGVSTWALVITKPSDLGYDDEGYDLPPLEVRRHVVSDHYNDNKDRDGQYKIIRPRRNTRPDSGAIPHQRSRMYSPWKDPGTMASRSRRHVVSDHYNDNKDRDGQYKIINDAAISLSEASRLRHGAHIGRGLHAQQLHRVPAEFLAHAQGEHNQLQGEGERIAMEEYLEFLRGKIRVAPETDTSLYFTPWNLSKNV